MTTTPTDRIASMADRALARAEALEPTAPNSLGTRQAAQQATILAAAAQGSTSLYVRTLLARLAREWARAANDGCDLADTDEDVTPAIVPAASLAPGALVYHPSNGSAWATLVRTMVRDGQVSLHLEADDGRPVYVNLTLAGSPVVVMA